MTRIYLDHNATTPVDPAVLVAMVPYFSADFANASSIHTPGQRARAAVEIAREQVAALINAKPQEIIFTSGGTESDNHAIFGSLLPLVAWPSVRSPNPYDDIDRRHSIAHDKHLITTTVEHEAVLNTCQELEKRGVTVAYLSVDKNGLVNPEAVQQAIRIDGPRAFLERNTGIPQQTQLITIMHANNELGTIQPLAEIGRIAKEHKILFHTDAVQSAGKVPIDVSALNVDLLSLSAHKLYGPKGVGALYVRTGTKIQQLLYGGHHQRGFRPGTENVAAIVGFGEAAELALQSLASDSARISVLRDQLERGLLERVPHTRVNGAGAPRTPNTTNILFEGIEGEALVIALDLRGIACSIGAACSSGAVEPSHVLTAIGLSHDEAKSSLRFSLGRHTTAAEIGLALELVPAAVSQLRALSPTYQKASAQQ
jgi:cysteine desulfurase